MIANALDSEGTLSAAKISRKLKQLGLYVPKKRNLETNLQLMDEASDASTEGSDNSDDETLLSMRRSKHQGKGSTSERKENQKTRKRSSKDASDDELLSSLLVKTKRAVPQSEDGKLNINSMKLSSESDTEDKDTYDSERGELDQATAMGVTEFNNTASDVDGDVNAGNLATELSSEQYVRPGNQGDQQLQEKFHSELSDFEDDDASLEVPITTVSRRRLRMVIDVEEDE